MSGRLGLEAAVVEAVFEAFEKARGWKNRVVYQWQAGLLHSHTMLGLELEKKRFRLCLKECNTFAVRPV